MPNCHYSPDRVAFLKKFKNLKRSQLTQAFNAKFSTTASVASISEICSRYGFKSNRCVLSKNRIAFLKQHAHTNINMLYGLFNKKFGVNYTKAAVAHLRRNIGIKQKSDGRFKPGCKPWNTGTKGLSRPNSGCFQKGCKSYNEKQMGYERLTKDGYVLVRVADGTGTSSSNKGFKLKQRIIYEQTHQIVLGNKDIIKFRDGDKTNFEKDNLVLITRSQLARLNQNNYDNSPNELKPAIFNLCLLFSKIQTVSR